MMMCRKFFGLQRQSQYGQKGFSVVEALAAIALVAFALLPLLSLQSYLTRTAIAAERAKEMILATENSLAYLKTINPLLLNNGTQDLGAATLRWTATPTSSTLPIRDTAGSISRWNGQLFLVEAVITFEDGRESKFSVHKFGWRPTQPFQPNGIS